MIHMLVCGDSFHTDDNNFPGIHWTNHLPGVKCDIKAFPGASNGHILEQLLSSQVERYDAIFIGFTTIDRIEIDGISPNDRLSNCHRFAMNDRQKIFCDEYDIQVPTKYKVLKQFALIREILSAAKKMSPTVVYSNGGFDKQCWDSVDENITVLAVDDFYNNSIPFNLWDEDQDLPPPTGPSFHINNIISQQMFANEVFKRIGSVL